MSINFSILATPISAVVPIVGNEFQYNRKKFKLQSQKIEDGWWTVTLCGNKADPVEPYVWLGVEKATWVSGYSYGNQIIFHNFDVAKRLWNISVSSPIHFNCADTFSAIRVIAWEDGRFFYACINYSDVKIYEIKTAYDDGLSIDNLKGVTQELRTLYLFHAFERDQLLEMLRKKDQAEEHERLMKDTAYRLKVTIERAGGKLIGYSRSGNRLIVDWELTNGSYKYNSVLNADTWKIIECGYCCSGDDKRHNLTSMVKTAEEYEERGVVFVTRH